MLTMKKKTYEELQHSKIIKNSYQHKIILINGHFDFKIYAILNCVISEKTVKKNLKFSTKNSTKNILAVDLISP